MIKKWYLKEKIVVVGRYESKAILFTSPSFFSHLAQGKRDAWLVGRESEKEIEPWREDTLPYSTVEEL